MFPKFKHCHRHLSDTKRLSSDFEPVIALHVYFYIFSVVVSRCCSVSDLNFALFSLFLFCVFCESEPSAHLLLLLMNGTITSLSPDLNQLKCNDSRPQLAT